MPYHTLWPFQPAAAKTAGKAKEEADRRSDCERTVDMKALCIILSAYTEKELMNLVNFAADTKDTLKIQYNFFC